MDDLISRQAAIDGLSKLRPRMIDTYEKDGDTFLKVRAYDVNDMLEGLPSAQPEIIRCKDCKRWNTVIDREKAEYGLCQIRTQLEATSRDDWCSRAERREDD